MGGSNVTKKSPGSCWTIPSLRNRSAVVIAGPFSTASDAGQEYVIAPVYEYSKRPALVVPDVVSVQLSGRRVEVAVWNARPVLEASLGEFAGQLDAQDTDAVLDAYWHTMTRQDDPLKTIGRPWRRWSARRFRKQQREEWSSVSGRVFEADAVRSEASDMRAGVPIPDEPTIAALAVATNDPTDRLVALSGDLSRFLHVTPQTISDALLPRIPSVMLDENTVMLTLGGTILGYEISVRRAYHADVMASVVRDVFVDYEWKGVGRTTLIKTGSTATSETMKHPVARIAAVGSAT